MKSFVSVSQSSKWIWIFYFGIIGFQNISIGNHTSFPVDSTDSTPPQIIQVETPAICGGDEFTVTFSESIQCESIHSSNFEIIGPGAPYVIDAFSTDCNFGSDSSNIFTIWTNPPLLDVGNYTFSFFLQPDYQVLDLCGNPSVPSDHNYQLLNTPITALNLGDNQILCEGDTLFFDVTRPNADTYLWQNGSTQPTIIITETGDYTVSITNICNTATSQIHVDALTNEPVSVDLGNDTILCPDGDFLLDATWRVGSEYLWQDGSTSPFFSVTKAGIYEVQIQDFCGATGSASIAIQFQDSLKVELGNDTILCEGETFSLIANNPLAQNYNWQNGSTESSLDVMESGIYSVTVSNECMAVVDSVLVTFIESQAINIDLGNDTLICGNTPILLDANWGNAIQYLWLDGTTSSSLEVNESGLYQVEITDVCGEIGTASIQVNFNEDLLNFEVNDTTLCLDNLPFTFDINHSQIDNYEWGNGSNQSSFIIEDAGLYAVTVSNQCDTVFSEFNIDIKDCTVCNFFIPNAFSPHDGGANSKFRPFSNCEMENYSMKIFNRWGALVFETNQPEIDWNGQLNNQLLAEGVYLYWIEVEVFEQGQFVQKQMTGDVTIMR